MTRAVAWFASAQFVALLAGVSVFLWQADALALAHSVLWVGTLTAVLWTTGAVMQGRLTITEALMVDAAALATVTQAAGLIELHRVFKPMVMAIAIFLIARSDHFSRANGRFPQQKAWLLAALAASLAGDAFLMFPGYFIPGLVSFLLAHLAYIAMLRLDAPWFASRRALVATLGVGAAMYAFLWAGGLPSALRAPVAAYVVVIALMAAQAIGRAQVRRDRASLGVALGACFFMLSDSLLAVNRFVMPLPLAPLWVLGTYYAAQGLIVCQMRRGWD